MKKLDIKTLEEGDTVTLKEEHTYKVIEVDDEGFMDERRCHYFFSDIKPEDVIEITKQPRCKECGHLLEQ